MKYKLGNSNSYEELNLFHRHPKDKIFGAYLFGRSHPKNMQNPSTKLLNYIVDSTEKLLPKNVTQPRKSKKLK